MLIKSDGENLNLLYFLYEIVHHCNLNCKGCDHCAPIAEKEFIQIEQFVNDLNLLKSKFSKIFNLGVMGGEPLLHPNLEFILKEARRALPRTLIAIFTNGILLNSFNDDFWKMLKRYQIIVVITKYNIKVDYKKIEKKTKKYEVPLSYMNNGEKFINTFSKIKFDVEGTQNPTVSYEHCYHKHTCFQLENGILYKCPMISTARHFNKYFKVNMEETELDGIDLSKEYSNQEILNYANNPIPFCRYCNVLERSNNVYWELSKKLITEWT